jgi:hypothetical protein
MTRQHSSEESTRQKASSKSDLLMEQMCSLRNTRSNTSTTAGAKGQCASRTVRLEPMEMRPPPGIHVPRGTLPSAAMAR